MRKSIKINYLYSLMYELLAIFIPFITIPYVSRVLGATAIGDYNYIYGILTYFSLIAINGTVQYSQREIAVCSNNKRNRSIMFWEFFTFRLISTSVVLIIYIIFINNYLLQYQTLFFIHFLTIISWVLDISWYFQGVENFKLTSIRNSIVKILGTILIFVFVKGKDDLGIYTFIIAATALLGNLTMWMQVAKEVEFVKLSQINIFRHLRGITEFFIPVISMQLYTVLDKTMLGTLCDTTQVGYYSQAENMIKLVLTCVSSLFVVLLPRLSITYRNGDNKELNDYYSKAVDFTFLLAMPMGIGCVLIADAFVPIFWGEGFSPVATLLKIESSLFIVVGLGRLFGNFLISVNRQNKFTFAVTCAAIINVILNYISLNYIKTGAYGVAIASIIAEVISTGIQMYYLKDILNINYIFISFKKYIFPCLMMLVGVIIIQRLTCGIVELLLSIVIGAFIYFTTLILCGDQQFILFLKKIKK